MKMCAIIGVLCLVSMAFAVPIHSGMVFYQMPYYNPYHQAMLVHYSPSSFGRSATSAFATGDAVGAGSLVKESRIAVDHSRANEQAASTNDGNVEAIAEAYPEEPIEGAVQYDQGEEQYNEVIPLHAAPVSETPKEATENIVPEQEITASVSEEPQVQQTTVAPKKKVHIALDIPDKNTSHDDDEDEIDDDDQYPYAPQKPNKGRGGSPVYTFFPVSFGRAAGGTIAVANAYSTGKGAVRSHAIAYGSNGSSSRRQPAVERHIAAQKNA